MAIIKSINHDVDHQLIVSIRLTHPQQCLVVAKEERVLAKVVPSATVKFFETTFKVLPNLLFVV